MGEGERFSASPQTQLCRLLRKGELKGTPSDVTGWGLKITKAVAHKALRSSGATAQESTPTGVLSDLESLSKHHRQAALNTPGGS